MVKPTVNGENNKIKNYLDGFSTDKIELVFKLLKLNGKLNWSEISAFLLKCDSKNIGSANNHLKKNTRHEIFLKCIFLNLDGTS